MKKYLQITDSLPPIFIHHITCDAFESDTGIEIYDANKLTVFLTDGLVAVLGSRLLGGQKGDILLFNPQEVHFGRFLRCGSHSFIEFYFPQDFFTHFCCDTGIFTPLFAADSDSRINCIRPDVHHILPILTLAQRAADLTDRQDPSTDPELFAVILQLLTLCAECYPRQQLCPPVTETPAHVLQIFTYIEEHFSAKITIDDIAARLGCSTVYLSRLFKKYTGTTIYNYLTEYRINHAATLLKSGCSVTEACYLSGFGDCSNFIRTFTRIMKTTPKQYRKR